MNEQSTRRPALLAGALVILTVTVLAYLPATRGGFVWDDEEYVQENPLLHEPDGLWRIWFSTDQPSQYFPLVYTAFRLQYGLWGLNPAGYHVTNILLHACNALLVWWLLRRLGVAGSWIAAAVFALHPVHVESVAWITELKNVLMLFFFLLSLRAWTAFADHPPGKRPDWRLYALSLLLYLAALLAKTTACTLPAALVLILWLRRIALDRRRWLQVAPFVGLGLAMGLLTMWWERFQQGLHPALLDLGLIERPLIAARALWFYLGKLIWPVNLAFSYPKWDIEGTDPLLYLWPLSWLVVAGGLWHWRERVGRGSIAAIVFFATTLSPMLGFIKLWTFNYAFVADHYQYAASIGPIALIVAGGCRLATAYGKRGLRVGAVSVAILLAILAGLTHRQSAAYESRESLWRDTLRKNPDSWMARINLGAILTSEGRFDEALEHYRAVIDSRPELYVARYNLGGTLLKMGRGEEAVAQYRAALEINPEDPDLHTNLARALESIDDPVEAARHYRRAMELDPSNENAQRKYAGILASRGQVDDAIAQYRTALERSPDDAGAHFNLANALREAGRIDQAVTHYRRAIEIEPENPAAQNYLGSALVGTGRGEEGIAHLREALRIDPGYAPAHHNLADALRDEGQTAQALQHYEMAVVLDAADSAARGNLAELLAELGRHDDALAHYRELLRERADWPEPMTHMAWILATRPDPGAGDRREAVRLAERAAELTERRNALVLYTLATAYAANGRAAEAREASRTALELAEAAGTEGLAQQIRLQLRSYEDL